MQAMRPKDFEELGSPKSEKAPSNTLTNISAHKCDNLKALLLVYQNTRENQITRNNFYFGTQAKNDIV